MTATLIERITGRRRAAERKTLGTYRELVAAVADETDVDPARADAILLDAAKTPSQLDADVAELRQRRADAELAGRLSDLRREYEAHSNSQRTIRERFLEAERKVREEIAAEGRELARLTAEIEDCQRAAGRLRAGRPDPREPGLKAEKQQLETRRRELSSELGNDGTGLRGRLRNLKQAIAAGPQPDPSEWPGRLPPSIVPGLAYDLPALQAAHDLAEIHVRGATKNLADVESRLAEVNATLAEIGRNQLTP